MSHRELTQVQADLATMRRVVRLDKPYTAADVLPSLVLGIGTTAAILLTYWRIVPNPRICLLIAVSPGLYLYLRRYLAAKRTGTERPNLWSEYKWGTGIAILLLPVSLGWIWWCREFGVSQTMAGAPIVFCLGLAGCLIAFIDSSRRMYFISGAGAAVYGVALPLLDDHQRVLGGLTLLAIAAFASAFLIWWNTRVQDMAECDSEPVA